MNYTEQAITFDCAQETLVGILALPQAPSATGVVVVVGGPQYRVGSHRQFTLLARTLAAGGYPVLRFDYRGMGDSPGPQRDFLQVTEDIGRAIDALQQRVPQVTRVALWGLCDGASAALVYCQESGDSRVTGLCLLNPWVRSQASLARAHVKHYYTRRLRQKEFWIKLSSGKVATAALAGLWQNLRLSRAGADRKAAQQLLPFQQRMARAWRAFGGSILLLLSGDDYTAKEFLEYTRMDGGWAGLLERPNVARHDLPGTDHTFSNATARAQVEELTLAWLRRPAQPDMPTADKPTAQGQVAAPAPSAAVEVYRHPDELPPDVQTLFGTAEALSIEFGLSWYRNLVNTVYPRHPGVTIYVLRSAGVPTAALPVILTRRHGLWTDGESLSNYYTALYAPVLAPQASADELAVLVRAMRRTYASLGSLRFTPMDPQSDSYRILRAALVRAGMVPFDFFCFGNWFMKVDGNWPAYLQSRSGMLRSTIKRMGKKFAADGGTLEMVQSGPDLERCLRAYEQVYAHSWKGAEPYPDFMPGLVRACSERGWLRLGVAWLKDEPIAAQIWIITRDKADIYKLAYHEDYKAYAPGTLLTVMLMQQAFERDQVGEIDYLIGDDAYKKSWMGERRERWGLIAYNPRSLPGLFGLCREFAGRAIKSARQRFAVRRTGPQS